MDLNGSTQATKAFFALKDKAFPPEEDISPQAHCYIMDHIFTSTQDRIGIEASRGLAKSRLVGNYLPIILPLLGIGLCGVRQHKFIMIISATFEGAVDMIQEIKDLYDVLGPSYQKILKKKIWKADEISFELPNGEYIAIAAMGGEGKIRGIRRKGARPDLIIFDDSEHEELVLNPERMKKWKRWVARAAIPAFGKYGVVIWIGTPLPNSLLEELKSNKKWNFISLPIQDDRGTPAWIGRFNSAWIVDKKEEMKAMGEINAWYQEYELKIISEEEQIFKPDMIRYKSVGEIPDDLDYYVTCDLAISSASGADRTAFVVSGVDVDNNVYVLEIYAERSSPSQQVGQLLSIASRYFEKNNNIPIYIGMERGALKHAFIDQWERRLLDINYSHKIPNIQDLDPYGGKNAKNKRIQQLETLFYRKKIYLTRGIKNISTLEEELLSYPAARHDDISDAFSYVLQMVKWREKPEELDPMARFWNENASVPNGVIW